MDFQPFLSCRPQNISQERWRALASKSKSDEYKSAFPGYVSGSFWKESMELSTETTEDRRLAQLGAWDGVTSSAFPQACFFIAGSVLFCVKLRPPCQPQLGHPEQGGLQKCLEIHICLPLC